ncbi:PAS domain S-box protein [bacterium]|nr:PAS domain S-box protein [bacterium]MBU1880793.1 PAS domain S-box protein [bacterium]
MMLSRDGVVCTSEDGSILRINERACKLLDCAAEEVMERSLLDLHPEQIANHIRRLFNQAKSNGNDTLEITEEWGNDFWITVKLRSISEEPGGRKVYLIQYQDDTAIRSLVKQNGELREGLREAQKLSSIGVLASGIAHNLNGPLAVITGYLDLICSKNPDIEEIPLVLNQAERLKDIIANMMAKSRQEKDSRKKPINLNTLLKNELKFLESNLIFKHHIDKIYEFSPDLPDILGIYSDFSQCFLNIVNNALDAMNDSPVKRLAVKSWYDEKNIYIKIQDTGCGLDPEKAPLLFAPFYTTKPAVGETITDQPTGTGLGLSTTFQLIKNYSGKIEVDGAPGEGAAFSITIPLEPNRPPQKVSTSSEDEAVCVPALH